MQARLSGRYTTRLWCQAASHGLPGILVISWSSATSEASDGRRSAESTRPRASPGARFPTAASVFTRMLAVPARPRHVDAGIYPLPKDHDGFAAEAAPSIAPCSSRSPKATAP